MVSAYRQAPDERELKAFQQLSRREQCKTIASYQYLHDKGFGDHHDLVGRLKQHVKPKNIRTIVVAALVGSVSLGTGTYGEVKYQASEQKKDSFVQCLVDKDVKVYTASWADSSVSQEWIFADESIDMEKVKVDCYGPSPEYPFSKECDNMGDGRVNYFPSWSFHKAKVNGILSLEQVELYSGCSYNP